MVESIIKPMANLVEKALAEQSGSVLVFLPGQGEILRVGRELLARFKTEGWTEHELFSLHMALE